MTELIIFILILIVNLILGAFVLLQNPKNKVNQIFGILVFFIVCWITSNFLVDECVDPSMALLVARVDFATGILVTYLVFIFSSFFTDFKFKNVYNYILLFLVIFVASISLSTNYIVENVSLVQNGYDIVFGPLEILYDFFIFGFVVFSVVILIIKYKLARGLERSRILFVLLGLMATVVIAVVANLILPYWLTDIPKITRVGLYSLIFFIFFTSYSIVAHHLFDIRVIVKKSIVYSALLIFVLATYAAVIFIFTAIFNGNGQTITVKTMLPNLIAAVFIAAGFEPLRRWLTRLTDKILFKGEYEPQQVLNKLSNVLSSVLDLDEALSSIINVLVTEMRLERAAAFVLTHDPEQNQIVVKRAKSIGYPDIHLTLEPKNHLISYFEKYVKQISNIKDQNAKKEQDAVLNYKVEARPIITEELERIIELSADAESTITNTAKELKTLQAAIAIPIIVKGNLIGIFVLGGKKSGDIFTDSDLNLLTVVANQTAAAIEKARFYEEDQLKSEFVSIASHELLTPTSAIEGYLSMILDEGMGKVDAQAKGYLEKVYGSSKRLAHLVKDLLNVSRIEGGRIVVQSQNFDIAAMVNDVITETMPKAKQKNLVLKAEGIDRELPQVWADPDRVHQVLVNLIGNSIKYTEKGSITVRADFSLSVVRVSVIDTGVGIPKDEIPHLFEKFYRASNADNAGAQGTGLGLYITKNIVELMGGMIQVDSELGKGSVFSFSLPRAKDEKKKK